MPKAVRAAAFALLLLAVAALAYAPLFGSQYAAPDVPYLVRASTAAGRGAALAETALLGADGPLARLSLRISAALWTDGGRWTAASARWIRVENVLLLLGAAAFGRLVVRRALAPWTGRDGARASAGAFALLLACHPACVPAVARAGARGDLLALALGALAAFLFLRGREEKRFQETVAAALLVALAMHASAIGILLPPFLAVLELFSTRRQRPLGVRLRTSATTLVVLSACAGLETLTAPAFGGASQLRSALSELAGAFDLEALSHGLGALALPVTASPQSSPASRATLNLLAGALLLAAFQPALVAARSAPRLWGWLAMVATAAVLLALIVGTSIGARTAPPDERSIDLMPAAAVAAGILAVASTALSGVRRILIPASLAAGFTLLAQIAAAPEERAGASLEEIQADLAAARAEHGGAAAYLFVDPPELAARPGDTGLELLLDPSVCPGAARQDTTVVRGITREGLYALGREPEFHDLRRTKLVLLRARPTPGSPRLATTIPPPAPSSEVAWRPGELRSELLDVDPFEKLALRALTLPTVSTAEAPRMGWRSGESETFSAAGVWLSGAEGPVAFVDLSRCDAWLYGARPQRAWLEPPVEPIRPPELASDSPAVLARNGGALEPAAREDTWSFAVDPERLPRPLHGDARFVLALLELESLRYLELDPRPPLDGESVVFAVPDTVGNRNSTWAWSLELRCGEACIARARGRH